MIAIARLLVVAGLCALAFVAAIRIDSAVGELERARGSREPSRPAIATADSSRHDGMVRGASRRLAGESRAR